MYFCRTTWRLAAPLAGVWSAADDGTCQVPESRPAHEPRQRCPLHRLVRRPGAWQDARHPPGTPRRRPDSRARDSLARPAVVRTHRARDSRARHAVFRTRPAQDSRAANGPGTTGRHPRGHNGPRSNGPSSARATTGRARHGVNPPGHATRVGQARSPTIRRPPTSFAGQPPNYLALAAPLAGV